MTRILRMIFCWHKWETQFGILMRENTDEMVGAIKRRTCAKCGLSYTRTLI